jgi:hypothetical protein
MVDINELRQPGGPRPEYEVVMPVHPKDQTKVPFVIDRIWQFTDASKIHLPAQDKKALAEEIGERANVFIYDERDILPIGKEIFKVRPGWIYQQYLKLFQQVTNTDWSLPTRCFMMGVP